MNKQQPGSIIDEKEASCAQRAAADGVQADDEGGACCSSRGGAAISSSSGARTRAPQLLKQACCCQQAEAAQVPATDGDKKEAAASPPEPSPPSLLPPRPPASPRSTAAPSSTSAADGQSPSPTTSSSKPPLLPGKPPLGPHLLVRMGSSGAASSSSSSSLAGGGEAASSSLLLERLPRELLVVVLAWLRAWDLSALSLSCRLFSDVQLLAEVVGPMLASYGAPGPPASPCPAGLGPLGCLLEGLRFQEVCFVHRALSAPEPAHGYFISKAWATSHRRFAEAMTARRKAQAQPNQHHKRRSSSRERRESDVEAPWPEVNADLTCEHGQLRPLTTAAKGGAGPPAGKRRVIDKKGWRAVRRFYPEGRAFKTSNSHECELCLGKGQADKARLEAERRVREAELQQHPALRRLLERRTGAPPPNPGLSAVAAEYEHEGGGGAGGGMMAPPPPHHYLPLSPGIYHLLPRSWLVAWRAYIRDPKAPRPRPPECSVFLCQAHGLPLVPPHVSEFLQGERRGLLQQLGERSGLVSEIVEVEEWDALTAHYPTDFALKFSVAPLEAEGGLLLSGGPAVVTWSTAPCERCDPAYFDEAPVTVRNRQRKWSF